jgi:germination protein M
MKNNIFSKKLCKKALIAFVCCCLFFMSFLLFSCDDTSVDLNTDSSTNDVLENEAEEDLAENEETVPEEASIPEEEIAEEAQSEEEAEADEITINVYYSDQMAEYLIPESRIISSENKYVDALYELMKEPIDISLTPLIPDTTIINSVNIEEGNAEVDLSQEFLDDRFVSDTVDILLLYSIVNTLTQFPEVNSVTLYIDGEKLDILGELDLVDPVFKKSNLIKDN